MEQNTVDGSGLFTNLTPSKCLWEICDMKIERIEMYCKPYISLLHNE